MSTRTLLKLFAFSVRLVQEVMFSPTRAYDGLAFDKLPAKLNEEGYVTRKGTP